MKRSRGDDIEDLEATEPAVRRRPHQPSGSTNPLAAPVGSISPLASAMVALELAEASTGQMFGEHRNIQTTLDLPARFVCSDSERTGKGHRPVQRRSEILITIEGRREIMTHPVDSAEAIARFDYKQLREVRACEEFFTALFSRHLGLGRPCETVRTALAHAEDIYEGLSGLLKNMTRML